MKKYLFIATALVSVVAACQPGPDYKALRDEVTSFHDSLMHQHEHLVTNQMTLDTLLAKNNPDTATVSKIKSLRERMSRTENQMNTWMHAFEPDITGKSNDEAVSYFQQEKVKIQAIDARYREDLEASDSLIMVLKRNK